MPLRSAPYDAWREPGGSEVAQFHRIDGKLLVRFPGVADFRIDADGGTIAITAAECGAEEAAEVLLTNSILPMVANHCGGLFIHGSAVSIGGRAAAFVGVSRSGKTTLAGAFAAAGYPFLTEDAIELTAERDVYWAVPQAPALRLFADSRAFFGEGAAPPDGGAKMAVAANDRLPASRTSAQLAAIYLLGDGEAASAQIEPLAPAQALSHLLQHSFVLDVENGPRLAAHFERMASLAERIPCRRLDYPRRYDVLQAVIAAVVDDLAALGVGSDK